MKTCINIGGSKTIKSMLLTSDNSNSLNLLLLVRKKILRCMKDLKHLLKIKIIVYIYLPNSSRQT